MSSLIKPLQLGNRTFPVNIIQGPLAGVSCAPFRRLAWQYSEPAFSCTEMISCKTLLYQPKLAEQRFTAKDPHEGPVCFQLSSNDPQELAAATQRATELGADLIDLNCGCPVKKIRNKGAGSSLLVQPQRLYQLIRAMKDNTHVPVSIKIRVQGDSDDAFHLELAQVIRDAGADFLVVHGRHWTEGYDVSCHYDHIQFFVETLNIPVIGNGDIKDLDSLKKMFATGCAGVMIGRAGVGQPWLIKQLIAEMQQKPYQLPALKEIGILLIDHVSQLSTLLNSEKFALLQARNFAKYYARNVENKINFIQTMHECHTLDQFTELCHRYFTS